MKKGILVVGVIGIVLVLIIGLFVFIKKANGESSIRKFSSIEEIKNFIKENSIEGFGSFYSLTTTTVAGGVSLTNSPLSGTTTGSTEEAINVDFSGTNIQVEGVDEADITKTDGKYIYTISGNKIEIVNAYPSKNLESLSEIELAGVNGLFINNNNLIALVSYSGKSSAFIYNITDRRNPILEQNISFDGDYLDSRLIGDYVYLISTKKVNPEVINPPIYTINNLETNVSAQEIYYFNSPDENYVFTSIAAIDLNDFNFENKVYLTGSTQKIYVSLNDIYLINTKSLNGKVILDRFVNEVLLLLLPSSESSKIEFIMYSDKGTNDKIIEINEIVQNYSNSLQGEEKTAFDEKFLENIQNFSIKIQKEMEQTIIHKIHLDKLNILYKTQGQVNGHILNQFSMDEYGRNFRIATTTGSWGREQLNHVYILDEELKIVGSIEDLAPGEKIYSVRFLGERGYLITFRQVDPLFVLNLSNPENPALLGELKMFGYSDYLHFYDKDHLLGIGKNATENGLFQGVKLSLFDISDALNPKELHTVVIGERGTESEVLRDHKALLFNKEKGLLVLPISLVSQGYTLQGAYVYNLSLENGFSLRGIITSNETVSINESESFKGGTSIRRSFYINDVLYTISNHKIMANSLNNFERIGELEIGWIFLTNCSTLDSEEGIYKLQNSVLTSGTCFDIKANGIILDLNGYSVVGIENGGQGVNIQGHDKITVKNGEIANFGEGIKVDSSSENSIINLNINNNKHQGIYFFRSNENSILQNNFSNNCLAYGFGEIEFDDSHSNLVQENYIEHGSRSGIHIFNSNNNMIINNNITNNLNLGIDLNLASDNLVKNNFIFGSFYGIYVGGDKYIQGKNNQIINNTIFGNKLGSIELTGNSSQFTILANNTIELH